MPHPQGLDYTGGQYAPPPQLSRAITQDGRIGTPGSIDARILDQNRTHTPPYGMQGSNAILPIQSPGAMQQTPTQLKVKVAYAAGAFTTTLVVPISISYQSLKDRIDAKLSRTSSVSLGSGQVKLKYVDEGDFVTIGGDEDVQEAFEIWREMSGGGQGMAEVQLFVQ
jgi:cell division control protein 24